MAVHAWLKRSKEFLMWSTGQTQDSTGQFKDEPVNDSEANQPAHQLHTRSRLSAVRDSLFPSWRAQSLMTAGVPGRLAYLDGLRGVASLLVFFIHNQGWSHSDFTEYVYMDNAFGWNGQYHVATIPGIRLLFTGGLLAVSVFFLISGYVLSSSALRSIHTGDHVKLGHTLSSALFRRWLRLYIPVAATTFLCLTSMQILRVRSSQDGHGGPVSFTAEAWFWQKTFRDFSFLFSGTPWLPHNDHAWSIAYEFRGSILVFTALLAFSRVRHHVRLFLELLLAWYFIYAVDGWYLSHFCIGMFLCDLDLLDEADDLPFPRLFRAMAPAKTKLLWAIMAVGVYLGGVPGTFPSIENLRKNPGWYWLSFTVPSAVTDPGHFFRLIAATSMVVAIARLPLLRRRLEQQSCQYLGRVSYGLYLIHGPVLWTIGDRVYAAFGRSAEHHAKMVPNWINLCPLPSWGPLGLELNHIVAQLILLPFNIWLGDLVTKYIDGPSNEFAKSLWKSTEDDDSRRHPGVRLI